MSGAIFRRVALPSLLFASSAFTQTQEANLMEARKVRLQTAEMGYRLFKPKNYDATKKYPVVVALHGVGERGTNNTSQVNYEDLAHPWIEDTVQAKVPHFVVIPQCPPAPFTWSNASSTGAFSETGQGIINILDSLRREFPGVDPDRFYITGLSMGAAGTYHLLKNKPGFFAAAVPCAAGGADAAGIPAIAQSAVWHHHGANDGTGGRTFATNMEAAGHKVVRFVSQAVLTAPSLNAYRQAIAGGQTRESLLSRSSNITWDSLARAARGGAKFLYSELTGGDHRSGWMIAWHNPLLADWVFSKSKAATVTLAPVAAPGRITRNGATLAFGNLSGDVGGRLFSIQGQSLGMRGQVAGGRAGSQALLILPESR